MSKTTIPADDFVGLTMDLADWLMIETLGREKYKSFFVNGEGVDEGTESFNDEGQDIYNGWNDEAENFLRVYFNRDDGG